MLADGATYAPMDGVDASARRKKSDLEEQSVEVQGVLSSSLITHDDLRLGKYRGAQIDYFLVDRRWPFVGHFHHQIYWMGNPSFDHETWRVDIEGFAGRLRQEVGRVASRYCANELGDEFEDPTIIGCRIDLTLWTSQSTVLSVVGSPPRNRFRAGINTASTPDRYQLGRIRWTGGNNAGVESRVRTQTVVGSDTDFRLFLETPKDIEAGDTFDVIAGCNKQLGAASDDTTGHCINKFDNKDDFQGDEWIPGTWRTLRRPL